MTKPFVFSNPLCWLYLDIRWNRGATASNHGKCEIVKSHVTTKVFRNVFYTLLVVPTSWIWTRLTRHLGSNNAKNALKDQTRDSSTQRKMIKCSAGELHTFFENVKNLTSTLIWKIVHWGSPQMSHCWDSIYIYIYMRRKVRVPDRMGSALISDCWWLQ